MGLLDWKMLRHALKGVWCQQEVTRGYRVHGLETLYVDSEVKFSEVKFVSQ